VGFDLVVDGDVLLTLLCYAYILLIILFSSKMDKVLHVSRKASRKFLHIMIGNLILVIPFFTSSLYPVLVASPFIPVTFFASPYAPFRRLNKRLRGLADITEEGHELGLVFYAVSYTLLALFFSSKPFLPVMAAGLLPMAYGDAAASLIGQRYGKRRYRVFADKSLEGSAAMFVVSFISLVASLAFLSMFHPLPILDEVSVAVVVAVVATFVEGFSPLSFDNLTVPAVGALTFLLLGKVV
jgi:dolichol kinase